MPPVDPYAYAEELRRRRGLAPASPSRRTRTDRWVWPTTSTRLTTRPESGHVALDIGAAQVGRAGDPVFAPTYGRIEAIRWQPSGYGLNVVMRTLTGEQVILGHLQAAASGLRIGQDVAPGQVLGLMGSTGRSSGPHLHFEVRPGSVTSERFNPGEGSAIGAVDPRQYYGGLPASGTRLSVNLPASAFDYAKPSPLRPSTGEITKTTGKAGSLAKAGGSAPAASNASSSQPSQPGGIRIASTPLGDISVPRPGKLATRLAIGAVGVIIILVALVILASRGSKAAESAVASIPGTAPWLTKQAKTPAGRRRVVRAVSTRGLSEIPGG